MTKKDAAKKPSEEAPDPFAISQLKVRLHLEKDRLMNTLLMDLKNLRQRTDIAIENLRDAHSLDAHLIVNAGSITESIARWNLVRDLIPYLYPELDKK